MSRSMKTFLGLVLLILVCQCVHSAPRTSPVVNTTLGLIRGLRADDGDYFMYMGIPYAQVDPANRFGKAIPQEPFDDVFDAIDDSAICPQIEEFNNTFVGDLDCLHINIYTPHSATPDNPKPVMLMIFGGGFSIGFAGRFLYGPKYLVRHDVVLVTLNYRLGPYGFMCLEIPEIAGNEGMKDQTLAIRWIRENIAAFGGDPNKITAFGNSAGGLSVELHLASAQEKLFDQAIVQSGPSLGPLFSAPNRNALLQLAEYFEIETDDVYEATRRLSEVSERAMIVATQELGLSFDPCVEKQFEGVEPFMTELWVQAPIPKAKAMPVIMGMNDDEALGLINSVGIFQNDFIQNMLVSGFNVRDPNFEGMGKIVHDFYVGDEDITQENPHGAIDAVSDYMFHQATYKSIAKYLDNEAGDVYLYLFSYIGQRNFIRVKNNITVGGAAHADELGYLFDISYYEGSPNDEDQRMIDQMTALWTNFAKFGNPTPETSELLPVLWEPIRKGSPYYYLNLDTELALGARPFHARMALWELFYKANYDLQVYPVD